MSKITLPAGPLKYLFVDDEATRRNQPRRPEKQEPVGRVVVMGGPTGAVTYIAHGVEAAGPCALEVGKLRAAYTTTGAVTLTLRGAVPQEEDPKPAAPAKPKKQPRVSAVKTTKEETVNGE